MGIKTSKPYTPSRRSMTFLTFDEITKDKPEKSLVISLKKHAGRDNQGLVTSRHRGGGHKKVYRIIDFKRDKTGIPAKVAAIEYDPNRSARIALLHYLDGEKRYIIWPEGLKVGDTVIAGDNVDIKVGNSLPLKSIPDGTQVHNVELQLGRGAQFARSAGSYAVIMAKEGRYATLRLPSGETRKALLDCRATIGQVGNLDHENISIGKAGRNRWKGWRPYNRGIAMNPVDHPHGGGEGRSKSGRPSSSPWGWYTKGAKTRKQKASDKLILKRRSG